MGHTPARSGDADWSAAEVLGRRIEPGTAAKFAFVPDTSFQASYLNMPVFVARGANSGPTLCLSAGIHGDELNGVEVARRAFAKVDPEELRGTLIAWPIVNAHGVRSGNRYLSDRRDLNRFFPGKSGGNVASLIANAVFSEVQRHCDALLDLHTASDRRTNLPQVRADLSAPGVRELAIQFGVGIVVAGAGPDGSLRKAAIAAGIPAIIYEAGEPDRFQESEIDRGVEGVRNVMEFMKMIPGSPADRPQPRIYEHSRWVRAQEGTAGFFFPSATLGDDVKTGDVLGSVVDPFTDGSARVVSPVSGEIIGMALPQPVLPGYALFHVAWQGDDVAESSP